MKKKIIAGNWKMNMLPNEAIEFITQLGESTKDTENEIILCVPYTDLFYSLLTAQDTKINIGAQNLHWEEKGAYTGEVSGPMLSCIGVKYVIVGHSERRKYFQETDEIVNKKAKAALKNGLKPIICVGETLEEKEQGKAQEVITEQVTKALEGLTSEDLSNTIIAYEPVWAIGTGRTATAQDANDSIKAIREEIKKKFETENVPILYGGSVKAENAKELFSMPEIDGGLIGGASLKVEEFYNIVNYNQ